MNANAYKILPIFARDRLGGSRSGKKLYIGVGSAYYPKTRENIGVYLINRIAKDNNMRWEEHSNLPFYVVDADRVILAKVKTWEPLHIARSVKRIIDNYGGRSLEDVIFVHSDKTRQFGQYYEDVGGNFGNNVNLDEIKKILETNKFGRLAIGVEPLEDNYKPKVVWPMDIHLSQESLDQGYYLNTFTDAEERIFEDKVYTPFAKEFFDQFLKQSGN